MSDKFNSLTEIQVAKKIKESANQIWLAGLGAYSKAEQEGGKLFDALVKDGEAVESRTKGQVDRQVAAAKEKMEEMKEKTFGSWEKIEKAFDERVSKALKRLGIPTRGDIDELNERIDSLSAAIQELAMSKAKTTKKRSGSVKGDPDQE